MCRDKPAATTRWRAMLCYRSLLRSVSFRAGRFYRITHPLKIISRALDDRQADDLRSVITVQLGNGRLDFRKQLARALDEKLVFPIAGNLPFPMIDGFDGLGRSEERRVGK